MREEPGVSRTRRPEGAPLTRHSPLLTHRPAAGSRAPPAESPIPHPMAYDPGLVARVADVLDSLGERRTRQKNVFGGRGFLAGKSTFVIVWGDGLLVKTPP